MLRYWCQDESRIGLKTGTGKVITACGVKPVGLYQWLYQFHLIKLHLERKPINGITIMSGVVKIEIIESAATLKKLLKNARTPQQKERIQAIYWLKNNTVETVKQVALMLGRNPVTVQKWLKKYREGGIDRLLEKKRKALEDQL